MSIICVFFFFSSRRRHTRCALVTGVQTCALPISVLAGLGVAQHVLRWTGEKPETGIQAAARAARYRLLEDWCAEAGVLHLLLAHHREDQAETVLLRLGRGSGAFGLAGMSAVREREGVRVLRPLLGLARARLDRKSTRLNSSH